MDKKRKKELLKQFKNNKKNELKESLPFSTAMFEELFDYIDETIGESGCNHTLKYTKEFLRNNNLPMEKSIEWLEDNGGYCDCEVLANVEDIILDVE